MGGSNQDFELRWNQKKEVGPRHVSHTENIFDQSFIRLLFLIKGKKEVLLEILIKSCPDETFYYTNTPSQK